MSNLKKIILKRSEEYIEFGFGTPYHLLNVTGLHEVVYQLETRNNYRMPGTVILGSRQKERTIRIEAQIKSDYTAHREKLYRILPEGSDITVTYYDEQGKQKLITARVEDVSIDPMGVLRGVSISLLCPDPYFRDAAPTHYDMATWEGGLEFDLDLDEGEKNELETRVAEQIKTISNPSNVVAPLTITFRASGDVTNPQLENMTTGEKLQIDTSMVMGDEIVIYTRRGVSQKIIKNGKAANNLWHFGSSWLNLPIGDSVFRYDAEEGLQYLDVEIETTTLYRGA